MTAKRNLRGGDIEPPPIKTHPFVVQVVGSARGSQWVDIDYCRNTAEGDRIIARERTADATYAGLTLWRYRVISRLVA